MSSKQSDPAFVSTPVTSVVPKEMLPPKKRKINKKRRAVKRPTLLPINWHMYTKVRSSGSSAGHVDKYYLGPKKLYTFRPMVEVLAFVNDGTLPKREKSKPKSK